MKPPALLAAKLFIVLGSIALVLVACIMGARAQQNVDTLTWERPTTRVDGSPLAPAEILQYRIRYADEAPATGPCAALEVIVPAPDLSWIRSGQPAGRSCYTVSAIDTAGLESDPSNIAFTEKCPLATRINAAGACIALARPSAPANASAT